MADECCRTLLAESVVATAHFPLKVLKEMGRGYERAADRTLETRRGKRLFRGLFGE